MGKNLMHSGQYRDGKNAVNVKLSLIEFEEDGLHFVYSPALDLTGYGKTEESARNHTHWPWKNLSSTPLTKIHSLTNWSD